MIQKNIYELLNDVETDFTEYHEAQLLSDTDLKRLEKKRNRKNPPQTTLRHTCCGSLCGSVFRRFRYTAVFRNSQ